MNYLDKLINLEAVANEFGFEWSNVDSVFHQIHSECDEVKDALNNDESKARLEEELGDLLHSVVALCVFLNCDVYKAIDTVTDKVNKRINVVKKLTAEMELPNLKGQPAEVITDLWKRAKEVVYKEG
jgi:uncharacterized protein YabN with tetrapyrrole methylase and pyrophosphatase domain